MVLSMVSYAYAVSSPPQMIDDFESVLPWTDMSVNDHGSPEDAPNTNASFSVAYIPSPCKEGSTALEITFTLGGGWDYPDAAAPWEEGYIKNQWEAISDRAKIELVLPTPLDVDGSWDLHFCMNPASADIDDLGDLNVYGYNEAGQFGRTLIPCAKDVSQNSLQWWYPKDWVPAGLGTIPDLTGTPWEGLNVIGIGECGDMTLDTLRELNWGWGNVEFQTLGTMTKLVFEINSDTDMTTDMRELEGGDKYPIKAGVFKFVIDDLYFTPEPTTIALLGLGGLSLLRIRRKH